ncbi:DUF881 domain-containing protein, partial [Micromonospora chalcea]|uniref:DUF881 domain-containing protein n=1 Tax=Micromonospora chalcea TaxID=1874 RepID=UPI0011B094FC
CVGNTLLLHGRVYSPPFKIVAIGDPAELQRALDLGEERGGLLLAVVAAAVPGVAAAHRGTVADCNAVESSNAGTVTVETRST